MKSEKNWIPLGVMALGVILIISGIVRGEVSTLFEKAINICLECIGIG